MRYEAGEVLRMIQAEDKKTYKGFKLGETVVLNKSFTWNSKHYDKGMAGIIRCFAPCVTHCKNTHFLGLVIDGYSVSCNVDDVIK